MIKEIKVKPIGIIHAPYKEPKGMPIQGVFKKNVKGTIHLFPKYIAGLKDIKGFSHLILVYYFHRSKEERLVGKPFLEDEEHGIFAIRSPHRKNHIGISIVKLEKVRGNIITFTDVDVLDGTPLLDIKPYVKYFDKCCKVKSGWIDKHFKSGKIPAKTKIK
ncbi:MAG: tRNA (N6-threonylcarbamoyladenosine(37)-N6)-methyltransferase TrmO [Elusimicrobia bacterium CG1_02_37_114]|nr:MAG: tRNA (N6-threonylcarbamoyladenosine(37)-N6)-methyltransferase TrmO [Elusimicrobia bacterium CG1_02_37_114]PIV52336.1 MAG: tRNA (N6-threonylcarbamoyladenosine(37)-N6)-methyltransferase TrmO [Elusimicrobia bacterium CG02_land_8_20_14_3_00_37_13]PIZ12586.1 MAG: tRNA (N6-threonylcarbamoyladenosine(37)-N6)-methyltransferase TrmO [Elusimicrobia bacterium CG_4_10_14_0_8_um_filter_37_32]